MIIYLNGKFVEENAAKISIFDRSYLYGEGFFEGFRAYEGKPAFLKMHYERLSEGLATLGYELPLSVDQLDTILRNLLQKNQIQEGVIRLTVSGMGSHLSGLADESKMNISAFCFPFVRDEKKYEQGVSLYLSDKLIGELPQAANLKSTSYLIRAQARNLAVREKTFETLLRNREGCWVEGSKTNFFLVKNGALKTAKVEQGLLPGITRRVVIDLAKKLEHPVEEGVISNRDLLKADEIFLTGSTAEVIPVSQLKGVLSCSLSVGKITKELLAAYRNLLIS